MKYRYINVKDAIETTWMILEGLGYRKAENAELEATVKTVFDTTPYMELDAPEML